MTRLKQTQRYLSDGNSKTGDAASFDLPPAVTCPGATNACLSKCYAINMATARPNVARKYARNHQFADSDNFVRYMIQNIPHRGTIRIHCSGDFDSVEYIQKWIDIISTRTDCIFYAYSRSWRIRSIWSKLRKLAQLPNFTLNISCDIETGKPHKTCAPFKWCYLTFDDTVPGWLRKDDLIFRHNSGGGGHQRRRANAIKKGLNPDLVAPLVHQLGKNNTPICPLERGKKLPLKCSRCRICI